MTGKGSLRAISRQAYPELWEERTRLRRLRRLTAQALRARQMGDVKTMARMEQILRKLVGSEVFDKGAAVEQQAEDSLVQRGRGLIDSEKENGGNPDELIVPSRGEE